MKLKAFLLFFLLSSFSLLQAADKPLIKIETERTSLIYQVAVCIRNTWAKSLTMIPIYSICHKGLKPI